MKDKDKLDFIKNSLLKIVEVLSETKQKEVVVKKRGRKPKKATKPRARKKKEVVDTEEEVETPKDYTVTKLKDGDRHSPLEKMTIRKRPMEFVDIPGHKEEYNYLPSEKTRRRKPVKDVQVTCCKCGKKLKVHPELTRKLENDKDGDLGFKCDNCIGR